MTGEIWGLEEEAALLGISKRSLWDRIKQHNPPIIRVGNRVRFDEVSHVAFLELMRVKPTPATSTRTPAAGTEYTTPAQEARSAAGFARLMKRLEPEPAKKRGARK
jgi:hypothetical protein